MKVKIIKYIIPALVLFMCLLSPARAQADTSKHVIRTNRAIVYASDTVPVMHIPAVNIYDVNKYNYLLNSRKYRRIIRNVKKAHPYAVIANLKLRHLDSTLVDIDSKKERKEYTEVAEAEIMAEFENEIKRLTVKQGIILVKLIDRETGKTSYEVLKDIRGGFTAFFWQGIARLFGNNLKMQFDPDGEDKVIEDIVMAMEWGLI